jgi:hypothetical protein
VPFGALQTFREYKVRKVHRVRLCTRLDAVAKRANSFVAVRTRDVRYRCRGLEGDSAPTSNPKRDSSRFCRL